jgi:hypothetical protein
VGQVTVTLDGNDVTNVCVSGSWTPRLNRPAQAQINIPRQEATVGGPGSILKISEAGAGIVFHGRVLLCETAMGEDTGYKTFNAQDPMELWQWRPVRDADGDMSNPNIITDFVTGPEILEEMLINSNNGALIPSLSEGPLFLTLGTFETGGCDLTGAPVDWPMTIAQLTSLLVSTGCLDVVITPTDPGGGIMGTVDAYNGDYGTDLSGSVEFEYGTGAFNISDYRRVQDMSNMCNKLWYFAGPRILTPSDPAGDQHWCFNVQGDDPGLPDPIPNGASLATLLADRLTSRSTYGVRMEVQIFDAGECDLGAGATDCCGGNPLTALNRELWRNRWATESWIRMEPRDLIHITPTRETEIDSFGIGDLVGVDIPIEGVSGAQRVYGYTISWDNDGVLALSELQTSPTADA